MHNQRIALIVSAFVGIIGTFLPFMKSFINSVSLIETGDGTGYVIIVAFVVSIIVSFMGDQNVAMTKGHLIGAIVPGVIPGAILLLLVMARMNDNLARFFSSFGIGFYLVVIASFLIWILGIALKANEISKPIRKFEEQVFCSGCGKRYSARSAGEFCDECGNKL